MREFNYQDYLKYKELKRRETKGMLELREIGKKEGIFEMLKKSVKNMIQFGEDEEKIMKYMKISKEELEKIKKTM